MKKTLLWTTTILLTFGTGWGAYAAYRAHLNLVTLNVRDADLRAVVRSIEWQTWEKIIVHHDVTGKVTLNVHNAPLERVLTILSEQTSARWTALYPLYSSRKSLAALQNLTAGSGSAQTNGWSAYPARGMRFGGGMFGANLREQNQTVSLKVLNKDINVAALALQRFAQAQVVPEDGTKGSVYLSLSGGTMQQAVSRLAKQVDRSWTRFYAMEPGFRPDLARRDAQGSDGPPVEGRDRFEPSPEQRERMEQMFQAQLDTMTPEERQQAEERRQQWQEIRSLPPDQRRERIAQMMSDPGVRQQMMQRMVQRIKDTTPDQRAERVNQILARRAARAAARAAGAPPPSRGGR